MKVHPLPPFAQMPPELDKVTRAGPLTCPHRSAGAGGIERRVQYGHIPPGQVGYMCAAMCSSMYSTVLSWTLPPYCQAEKPVPLQALDNITSLHH